MKVVLKGNLFETEVSAALANKGESHCNSTNTDPTATLVIQ
jgi:hypothetical protein